MPCGVIVNPFSHLNTPSKWPAAPSMTQHREGNKKIRQQFYDQFGKLLMFNLLNGAESLNDKYVARKETHKKSYYNSKYVRKTCFVSYTVEAHAARVNLQSTPKLVMDL